MTADWLERRFGAEMTVLPFDLHPEYPVEGMPRARLRERYGEEVDDYLIAFFGRSSLRFNPPEVMPNSRSALRLTELGRDRGVHRTLHDRLMAALWDEGRDLGDVDELRTFAAEAGLDADEVDGVLAGDAYLDRIAASTRQAQSIGITGIPAFLIDRRLLVLGAQPQEAFEQAIAQLQKSDAT